MFAPKILRKHRFQFLLGKLQYPEEIENKVYWIVYVIIHLTVWEQTRCIMGDVQMANSFHLNRGTPSRTYRQRNAFQIKGFVWEYLPVKMKENSHHSHICPKASFVLGSFRAMLSSHSAYYCPLSRLCRISCFPVYKLVRFYVNSSKKPNTSIYFTVAFSNIFHDNFVVFIFGMESYGYTF